MKRKRLDEIFWENRKDLNIKKRSQSKRRAIKAVADMIGNNFPGTPQGKLCGEIVVQAVRDMVNGYKNTGVYDARAYIESDMEACLYVGVDPEFIRELLRGSGFLGRYKAKGNFKREG